MKVFVYGTLIKGLQNHSVLRDAIYLGKGTVQEFGLYCVTPYFPGAVPMMGSFVNGEVYEVTKAGLKQLDALESEGSLYSRYTRTCTMEDGMSQRVYIYGWNGSVIEDEYIPGDFTPWHPGVREEVACGMGKTHFYFFAYGRYCNEREMRKLLRDKQVRREPAVVGVGVYRDHRLAFTRKKSDGAGALDLLPSEGDYALGIIYRLPIEALTHLNRKEGYPSCYGRSAIKVRCGGKNLMVQAYTVVDKHLEEVAPDEEYYNTVREGMLDRYPVPFINKYLVEHCNEKFGFTRKRIAENHLYHQRRSKPLGYTVDPHFAGLVQKMAVHLGNKNNITEAIKPTPEMFRLLVKLVDMQLRDVLDYGYSIPRHLTNHLAAEFERLTGLETGRLPEC